MPSPTPPTLASLRQGRKLAWIVFIVVFVGSIGLLAVTLLLKSLGLSLFMLFVGMPILGVVLFITFCSATYLSIRVRLYRRAHPDRTRCRHCGFSIDPGEKGRRCPECGKVPLVYDEAGAVITDLMCGGCKRFLVDLPQWNSCPHCGQELNFAQAVELARRAKAKHPQPPELPQS